MAELGIESALTEAHLEAHPSRAASQGYGATLNSESWLKATEAALAEAGSLVADEDRDVFDFRVDRQRAWLERRPQSVASEHLRRHPYVAACIILEETIIDPERETVPFMATTPGLLMLLPALRSRGLVEDA